MMLSLVLPLLVLAIALTPVIVSARMLYKRDLAAQVCESGESQVATTTQSRQASIPVKTTV